MAVLVIEKQDLKHNIKQIKEYAKKSDEKLKIIAIVKSNGYGLGLKEYSNFLIDNGIEYLAVASTEEAIKLRSYGIKEDILMMSSTAIESEIEEMVKNNITITIGSKEAKEALINVIKRLNKKPKIHIKIDTGFGRYGYLYNEEEQIIGDIKKLQKFAVVEGIFSHLNKKPKIHIKIDTGFGRYGYLYNEEEQIIGDIKKLQKFAVVEGIFSHFSTSFYKEKWTNYQYENFINLIKKLEENEINIPIKHISNSSAFIRFPNMNLNAVRIGSAFLGRIAVANKLGLKKIGYLESEISEIKILPKGWNIGYSNTYKTKKETKVAIIPTGYAEGYHMRLENDMLSTTNKLRDVVQAIKKLFKDTKLYVEINNKKYAILGRIGMYHLTVDITGENLKIGEKVKMNANPLYVDSSVRRLYK